MIVNPNVMAAAGGGGGAVIGTYTGDGTVGREIALPFAPALLIVEQTSDYNQCICFITGKHCRVLRMQNSARLNTAEGGLSWLTTSIDSKILKTTSDTNNWLNSNADAYTYIAIPKA